MLIHFPIALVVFGYLAELGSLFIKKELCLSRISLYLLVFGTLTAISAYMTGQLFTTDMAGTAENIRQWHETFAGISMGLLILTASIRTFYCYKNECNKYKWFTVALYSVATVSVSITGYLGGTLVYNYMMPL